jgi:protein-tyrosine-phosphatase
VSDPPEVLFVCVHNAGRSQMAVGFADRYGRGRVCARSAGTAPGRAVQPAVVAVMAEVGVDLSGKVPALLTDDAVRAASVVVDMGCGDTVPIYPDTRYLTWDIDDPAGRTPAQIRPIRDDLDARVRSLLCRLGAAERVGLLRRSARWATAAGVVPRPGLPPDPAD